jgi:hypothetical protein
MIDFQLAAGWGREWEGSVMIVAAFHRFWSILERNQF